MCVELDTSSPFKFMVSLIILTITAPIRLVCEVSTKIMLTSRIVLLRVLVATVLMNAFLIVVFVISNRFPLRFINVSLVVGFGSLVLSVVLLVAFLLARNTILSDDINIHSIVSRDDYDVDDEYEEEYKEEYDDEYEDEYDDEYEDEYEGEYSDEYEDDQENSEVNTDVADDSDGIFSTPDEDAFSIFDSNNFEADTDIVENANSELNVTALDNVDISEIE